MSKTNCIWGVWLAAMAMISASCNALAATTMEERDQFDAQLEQVEKQTALAKKLSELKEAQAQLKRSEYELQDIKEGGLKGYRESKRVKAENAASEAEDSFVPLNGFPPLSPNAMAGNPGPANMGASQDNDEQESKSRLYLPIIKSISGVDGHRSARLVYPDGYIAALTNDVIRDGFVVKSITPYSVIIKRGDETYVLTRGGMASLPNAMSDGPNTPQ